SWCFAFDGQQFLVSQKTPDIIISTSIEDIVHFPSSAVLKQKVACGELAIVASKDDKLLVIELLESVNPVKVNQCVRYLRNMVGLKDTRIQDKAINELSIRDIASEADINYVRDQALAVEAHNPALAFQLMHLAHGARPKGPFIKRKLDEYRSKGFERLGQNELAPLKVIPVVQGKLAYFPLPKVACSSIKTALYEMHQQRVFDSHNYRGLHVHDYWLSNMSPIEKFERTVIVVRDPIERFISAYASRVLDHGELNRIAIERSSPWLAKSVPHFKPTLSQFVAHLDVYLQVPSIAHHCQPLSTWVHDSLEPFSDVVPMSNMVKVQSLLSDVTKKEVLIPRNHVGKNRVELGRLSRGELDYLLGYYQRDYELLAAWYTPHAIIEKWQAQQKDKV
uniref:sulfotransferase family 2 domain-containing protein n=1 Tax=Thaumasiovibrio occultus TaxID=1891184 RepID=UPI00131D5119